LLILYVVFLAGNKNTTMRIVAIPMILYYAPRVKIHSAGSDLAKSEVRVSY